MRKHIAVTCFALATFASVSGYAASNELFTSEDKARSDINQCDSILENAAHDISMALSYDETKNICMISLAVLNGVAFPNQNKHH